jgi:hypothetical protein
MDPNMTPPPLPQQMQVPQAAVFPPWLGSPEVNVAIAVAPDGKQVAVSFMHGSGTTVLILDRDSAARFAADLAGAAEGMRAPSGLIVPTVDTSGLKL